MPRGDRTGPMGLGPMTGRSMGYCSGSSYPGFMNPGPGMGFARGFGRAAGFGRGMAFGRNRGWAGGGYPFPPMAAPMMPYSHPYTFGGGYPPMGHPGRRFATPYDPWGAAPLTPEQELDMLKAQAEQYEDELSAIEKRIKELENEIKGENK